MVSSSLAGMVALLLLEPALVRRSPQGRSLLATVLVQALVRETVQVLVPQPQMAGALSEELATPTRVLQP